MQEQHRHAATARTAPLTARQVMRSLWMMAEAGIRMIGEIAIIVAATPVCAFLTATSDNVTPMNGPRAEPSVAKPIPDRCRIAAGGRHWSRPCRSTSRTRNRRKTPRSLVEPPGSPWGLCKIKFPISVSISSGLPGARYNAMRFEKEFT